MNRLDKSKKLYLNIGCGDNIKKDESVQWINIDCRKLKNIDYVMQAEKLEFENNVFDMVYVTHVLEHFSWKLVPDILKEWIRVLKPKGELYIAVPDILKIAQYFSAGKLGADMVFSYLYGGQGYDENFHKAGFCHSTLTRQMKNAGLKHIQKWVGNKKDASGSFFSLNLKGMK